MKLKKTALLSAIVLLLCFCLAGCGAPALGDSIKGKTATIVLDENPTTGYTWAISVDNESVVSMKSDKFYEENSDLVGSGGVHEYVFEAMGPGTATITFSLGQQWDGGEKDNKVQKYKVTVDDSGKITALESI